MPSPTCVVHVPHASRIIPSRYRDQFFLNDLELDQELVRMTDSFTDELFAMGADLAATVRHDVSRLLVDPERFEDDAAEPMAGRGMGVIYQRTSLQTPLRSAISDGE